MKHCVQDWRQTSSVSRNGGPNHWQILRALLASGGTAGNFTSDAHLAAHAIEGGWTLVSTDHDFRRFGGLNVFNPATG